MFDSEQIKNTIKKGIKIATKPIIIFLILAIILVSLFWSVIDGILDKSFKIFNDVVDNVKLSGNNIEIDQEYLEEAKERLKRWGINPTTLGLGNDEDYLERFLEAEIVTNFPYLGGDGLQGTVYFERAKVDGTTIRLSYLEYNEFYNKVNNGEDVDQYFTVDPDDWTVHVKKIDGTIEKINYKNMVEKFAMPFEFPMSLAMTSQNPQFALAVVNLVKESRIVITIAESETTTTTTVTEHYDQTVTQTTPGNGENPNQSQTVSHSSGQGTPQVTTETTYSTEIFLSSARTWILNEITDLKYDESSQDSDPVTTELSPTTSTETRPNGTVITINRTNRTSVTQVHTQYRRWIRGTTKVIEKSENFTKLIINDGATNGNGFVQIAKRLHDYLAENQYYYSSQANIDAGCYVQDGTAVSSIIPSYPDPGPMSGRYLCCTTFSAWVLMEAGYDGIDCRGLDLLDDSIKDRGWEVIDDLNDVKPGDICFWYDNKGQLAHTNVCASREADGTLLYYDTGATTSIRAFDPIQYNLYNIGIRKFAYAYRPNDEIAKSLGAGSISELKEDIESYIETSAGDGNYSVSVVNLDKTSDKIGINSQRVKSNGLIKLFIMATAYNEINAGRLNEDEVSTYLESMIIEDRNVSANSLLEIMGDGDIAKGVDKVNAYCRQNSYTNTKLEGELEQGNTVGNDQTYTSVNDVSTLLRKIFKGTCVNQGYSDKMMNLLKGQLITDMIPSTISNAEVANKTGEQNGIVQDAAIISTENANYLIVVSASEITNTDNAKNNIREIANMVNLYFEQYGGLTDNSGNYQEDEIETRMNGDRVCYKLPSGEFQCPLNNLVEAREMLFELLGKHEKTQSHERLMRYLLYLLTGNDYGVTEFDFNEFLNGSFVNVGVGAGDYIVDTTQSSKEIVITDRATLSKAFSWYSNDRVLQQYVDYFLECQKKYHVNAVFAAAVSITESSAGTNIAIGGNNMFSITANGVVGEWNSYGTMEGSIESFFKLISGEYFPKGQNTVSTIGRDPNGVHNYCWPPDAWITNTTNYMTEMFKTAGIDVSTYEGSGTDIQNKVVELARSKNSFGWGLHRCEGWAEDVYRYAGLDIPPMPCATEAAWAWQVSTSQSNIPLGAMVFGHAYGVNHGGHNAGHVGIYVGNGEVVSNADGAITLESLQSWISRFGWKGWGWAGGIDLTKY